MQIDTDIHLNLLTTAFFHNHNKTTVYSHILALIVF